MYRQLGGRRTLRIRRKKRTLLLLFIILVSILFFLLTAVWRFGTNQERFSCGNKAEVLYDIVLDAGSTGTRVHVFEYNEQQLVRETFDSTRPGFSTLAKSSNLRMNTLLDPLMQTALQAVPAHYHACTRVSLKATAGLRLLEANKGELLLREAREHLTQYPFVVDTVSIISGDEEGIAAWITVTYLLGRMPTTITTGGNSGNVAGRITTIDMGGGSAQIVLPLTRSDIVRPQYTSRMHLDGVPVELYHYSFLGLGLKEATQLVMRRFPKENRTTFPCFPVGHKQVIELVDFAPYTLENVNDNIQDFNACAAIFRSFFLRLTKEQQKAFDEIRPLLSSGTSLPLLYAFSYFHDRMRHFDTAETITVGYYKTIAKSLCRSGAERNMGTMCMDLTYLYTFLSLGLGLSDEVTLTVPKKLRDVEVSWALGTSLLSMRNQP
ncbi:putative nucleoside diphosphatase [Trypanosoma theileri]|uniref:Putative nucleoside diphosphatase n=1 Tax=Trypanosoma theileri TaxID=67003 RepID=A0A1X0NTJ7_9TRYP|nr:putative nucleoside diphosphatase [Trypanosoma theileri]ORC88047.1 putative nucleoside diphosphatase [Trypanosoma theileri]